MKDKRVKLAFGGYDEIKLVKAKSFKDFIEKYFQELSSLYRQLEKGDRWIIKDKCNRGTRY